MARMALIISTVVVFTFLAGCGGMDKGKAQIVAPPDDSKTIVNLASTGETDIIEQLAANRQAYHKDLLVLTEYYKKTGNNSKLEWVQKELASLDAIPQYNYILEASVAGPELKASASIPEADELYNKAVALEEKAGALVVVKDDKLLRKALENYNLLIQKYPSSDKIDDSAYRAAGIYVHFQDYSIALLYLQRTYQWDPETPYPARFEVGYILDNNMHRRAEALEAYQQALKSLRNDFEFARWKMWTQQRISELTQSDKKID